jgi:hypothetical protein
MTRRQQTAQMGVAAPVLCEEEETRPVTDRHVRADKQLHSQRTRLDVRAHDAIYAVPVGECQTAQA